MIQTNVSPTLDGLFQRILARQPDAPALLDPINKARITGQAQRRMTFAQADRAIASLAAHFVEAGATLRLGPLAIQPDPAAGTSATGRKTE